MKKFFVILFFIIGSLQQINSQVTSLDSIVVSAIDVLPIYPLISDKNIEKLKKTNGYYNFIYPLLVFNGVIIREETKINCFRNRIEFVNIKKTKLISKEKAEKMGIPDVPKDGVLFVTAKKNYFFDFSCE